jgi:hypothetical protein
LRGALLLSAPLSLKPSCLLKPQTQCDSLLKNGGPELRQNPDIVTNSARTQLLHYQRNLFGFKFPNARGPFFSFWIL